MKMLNLTSAIVILGFAMSSNAAVKYQFVLADNSVDSKMCLAAVTNNKDALRRNILRSGVSVRTVAHTLMCNDHIVAKFENKYRASQTFAFLYRYTLKEDKKARPEVTIQDITATQGETRIVLIASK
jgi:hypothetical protein